MYVDTPTQFKESYLIIIISKMFFIIIGPKGIISRIFFHYSTGDPFLSGTVSTVGVLKGVWIRGRRHIAMPLSSNYSLVGVNSHIVRVSFLAS